MKTARTVSVMAPAMLALALSGCASLSASGVNSQADAGKPVEGPVGFNQTAYVDGPTVTPLDLLEDSRCPKQVECVWAGQVRIKARVAGGSWSKEMELTSGKPVQVADGALTLVEVTPEKSQNIETAQSGYRFTFRFQGGL